MTESNLEIVLANAICCSGVKASELSDMLSSGSKCVDPLIRDLKILNDSIEVLKCYNFPIDPLDIEGNFTVTVDIDALAELKVYKLIIDDFIYYTYDNAAIGNQLPQLYQVFEQLFYNAMFTNGLVFTEVPFEGGTSYIVPIQCRDIKYSLTITADDVEVSEGVLTAPICTVFEVVNCITLEEQDILAHNIMQLCDICDCELT